MVILVVKKILKNPDVEYVLNHFSEMYLPMLFKLDTQMMNDDFNMHVIFCFLDQIQDGRFVT